MLVKVVALTVFVILTLPVLNGAHFQPFIPNGWGTYGVVGAAASIFFAYVGFDAVSTAAEETKNPQRNVPIGLIGIAADLHGLLSAGRRGRDRRDRRAAGARRRRRSPRARLARTGRPLRAIVASGATEPLVCSQGSAGPCAAHDRLSARSAT